MGRISLPMAATFRVSRIGAMILCVALMAAGAACDGEDPRRARAGLPPSADEPDEPYPYTRPLPTGETSEIDGIYIRTVTAKETGGAGKCVRCPPYRLTPGAERLELRQGIFRIVATESAIRALGHFIVEGEEIVLFNDPNCPTTRGTYRWELEDSMLRLEPVADNCAFDEIRARYMSVLAWRETE